MHLKFRSRQLVRFALVLHAFAVPLILGLWFLPGGAGETARAGHRGAVCKDCHMLVANLDGYLTPVPDFEMQCRGCHTDMAATDRVSDLTFHSDPGRACLDCHDYHKTERMTTGDREFTVSFGNQQRRAACAGCHGQGKDRAHLSPGHLEAAVIYHSDFRFTAGLSASQACLLCHGTEQFSNSDLVTTSTEPPRFSEHASHPIGVRLRAGTGAPGNRILHPIDPRIKLVDNRIECQTCHDLTSTYPAHLAGFSSRDDLCRACHDVQ